MNKYALHTGQLSVDTATTMNYSIKDLMANIVENHTTLSWEVMGKETHGIIFVSVDEQDDSKLHCHGSMTAVDYDGEALGSEGYLWVMIDKVEAAFRARFITLEAVTNIQKEDFIRAAPPTPSTEMLQMAQKVIQDTARRNFARGFTYGALITVLMMAVSVGIFVLCL